MGKIDRHIEIVSSSIIGLSSMSKVSRDAIQNALSRYYTHVGITLVDNVSDLNDLVAKAPDLVFLGMKYMPKNSSLSEAAKIWPARFLAEHGVATTGSESHAHKFERDKSLAKKRVSSDGIKTAAYFVVRIGQPLTPELVPIDYPLFVKPANLGGGDGIDSDSVVHTFSQLKDKVDSIARDHNSPSLVETYLSGREFSVAILKNENDAGYSAMPLELIAPRDKNGARIIGSAVKLADSERIEEVTESATRKSVIDLAIAAFASVGGRDYGRIDIRMDSHGVPHFLEANLIPSLIDKYGSFPRACALNEGFSYDEMLLRIVGLGMDRADVLQDTKATSVYADTLLRGV